jgi:hypothetical protein
MQQSTFLITGISPLLMHSGQLVNPFNAITKQFKTLSSKRDKTEADLEEMARVEWYGSLYLEGGEPCIPGEVLEAHLIDCAKKRKKGQQAKAGLYCDGYFPLQYDGPRTPDALWVDPAYRLTVQARVKQNRVMRTRPIFRQWALQFTVTYNPGLLNASDLRELLLIGGEQIGLCDWRPKFGRYVLEEGKGK